jgi:hypothetical protein
MFQLPSPALAAIIATLNEPTTSVETFIVSDGENEAVRLVLGQGNTQVIIDVEVDLKPEGGSDYFLSPHLTLDTFWKLTSQGLLPENRLDAMDLALQLATALTLDHSQLIAKTARESFTYPLI